MQATNTNIVKLDCPTWDIVKFMAISQGQADRELDLFLEHCLKCFLCRDKAKEIIKKQANGNTKKEIVDQINPNGQLLSNLTVKLDGYIKTSDYRFRFLFVSFASMAALFLVAAVLFFYALSGLPTPEAAHNIYRQLDNEINLYLTSKNPDYLEKARETSIQIHRMYEDNYGKDLTDYYAALPVKDFEKLLSLRYRLMGFDGGFFGDDYRKSFESSELLAAEFLEAGNGLEAQRAKITSAKMSVFLFRHDESLSVTKQGISFAENHNYLYLKEGFLLWQGKALSYKDASASVSKLLQSSELAERLNLQEDRLSALTSLTMLYHLQNDNERAFKLSQELLSLQTSETRRITILQVSSLSSFQLGHKDLAISQITEAIALSTKINSSSLLSRCYMFKSILYQEAGDIVRSEDSYGLALTEADKILDFHSRMDALFAIKGYLAKSKFRQGKYSEAIDYYQQSIDVLSGVNPGNNFALAQLNEAIALTYRKLEQNDMAETYLANAQKHKAFAAKDNHITNCLLSFVSNACD